jgi:hypothetical protein
MELPRGVEKSFHKKWNRRTTIGLSSMPSSKGSVPECLPFAQITLYCYHCAVSADDNRAEVESFARIGFRYMEKASWVVRKRTVHRDKRRGPGLMSWVWKLTVGVLLVIVITVGSILATAAGITAGVYTYYAKQLPDPSAIEHRQEKFETTKIYDRTGKHLLYEVIDPTRGDRTYVPLNEIPRLCREATIALSPLGVAAA